ncbi:hypothetical protein ACFVLG_35180 [Streptomyces rochei]|uniref:hypothetical protein n=1 Tax=Streptomyces rochei TaxID=1928 RepID=UPI0034174E73
MVSSSHEALHRIFQEDLALFARAVKALGVSFAEPVSAVPLTTDLTENRPVERRVDTLLRMETGDNGSFLLAVESQGKQDRDKPASWAYYLSHLHAKYRLPPVLLVVLKALASALKGLSADDENTASIFIELTEQGLGKTPAAELWRQIMAADLSFFQSETAQSLRAEGREKGRAEGRVEGRVEGRAEDILLLLERRGVVVSEGERARIVGCGDLDVLGVWFSRAITASSMAEVFGETE